MKKSIMFFFAGHRFRVVLGISLIGFCSATRAQTELYWNGANEGVWTAESAWKGVGGEAQNWVSGAVGHFPEEGSEEINVALPSEVIAKALMGVKNPLRLQGAGPFVLKREGETDSGHALNTNKGVFFDVPVVLDGGGMQVWVAFGRDRPVTINKGIGERSPTGISFNFGVLALDSPSTFTGGLALNNAVLQLGNDRGAGSGRIVMGSQKNTIAVRGGDRSIANVLMTPWIGGDVPWIFEGTGSLTLTAPVEIQGTERGRVCINVADGMVVRFEEGILPPKERNEILPGLSLTGSSGTLVLEKEITYLGKTTIEAGRLVMNGHSAHQQSWTLTGTGILAGNGTIGLATGEVFLFAAAKISPGMDDQVGTLKILGSMKVGQGFEYVWNFGARVPEGDVLDLGGSFLPDSAWGPWKVVVRPAQGATLAPGNYRWPIIKSLAAVPAEAVAQALVEMDTPLDAERFAAKLEPSATGIDLVMTVK